MRCGQRREMLKDDDDGKQQLNMWWISEEARAHNLLEV
jgi:hypothetical protein